MNDGMIEKLYDKDNHEIGEIRVIEDKKIVEIEINGMYWHHYFCSAYEYHWFDSVKMYMVTKKQGEFPIFDFDDEKREEIFQKINAKIEGRTNLLIKETNKQIGTDIPIRESKERNTDPILEIFDNISRENKNVWTDIYDENGRKIGNIEEALDFFMCLNIWSKLCRWIKFEHQPGVHRKKWRKNVLGKKLKAGMIMVPDHCKKAGLWGYEDWRNERWFGNEPESTKVAIEATVEKVLKGER